MNAEPHVHQVELRLKADSYTTLMFHKLTYGDTSKWFLGRWTPSDRRIRRMVRRVIARHDRGSVKAGKQAQRAQAAAVTASAEALRAHQQARALTPSQPDPTGWKGVDAPTR